MTDDPIWSIFCNSKKLIDFMHIGKVQKLQFAIPFNGHTTRIVYSMDDSFLMPNSSDMVHGLILPMGQDLPIDLLLDNISFLVFLSLETDLSKPMPPQFKQSLSSIKSRQWSKKLGYLFLKNVDADNMGEMNDLIQSLGLEVHNL
jgi:hypothetical protein